jgi:hypothetical protein
MFRARWPIALHTSVGVLACLALAGCGGSSDRLTAPKPHPIPLGPSRATYIKRAEALCKAQQKAHPLVTFDETLGGPRGVPKNAEAPFLGRKEFKLARKELAQLRGLTEPRADRETLAAIWNARSAQLNDAHTSNNLFNEAANMFAKIGQAIKNGTPWPPRESKSDARRLYTSALAAYYAGTRFTKLAKQFGLKACTLIAPTSRGDTNLP